MKGVSYETAIKLIGANMAHRIFDNYLGGGNQFVYEQGRKEADVLATIYSVTFDEAYNALNEVYMERFDALKEAHKAGH